MAGADEGRHRGSYLGFRCAHGPAAAAPVASAPAPAAIVIRVQVRVLTQADGTGNPLWTRAYTTDVLARATALLHGELRFELDSYVTVALPHVLQANTEQAVLDWMQKDAALGVVSLAIGGPHTPDAAGLSLEHSGTAGFRPTIVMRSRKNTGTDADLHECAAILLHELGHTLGFTHTGTVPAMPWPTDGWWDFAPARARLATLAGWFELHRHGASAHARDAFICKIGAPVPDVDQLYDPPTNAPTPAECAARCLAWPGCVATAQPTWTNARCFLFGRGALGTHPKNRGWTNVDTCWLAPRP
jgi:hypothetical protein